MIFKKKLKSSRPNVHSSKTYGRKVAKIEWNLQVSEAGRVDTGGVVDGGMNQFRVVGVVVLRK